MATEIAAIDDDGDGKGRAATDKGPDGTIAGLTYLDNPAVPTSADPDVQRLLTRQRELTDAIDDLRRRQASMKADEFDQQMDALVTELAQVSRDIRRRTGGN